MQVALIAILALVHLATADSEQKPPAGPLHETWEQARSRYKKPDSCESVYYDLFKPGQQSVAPSKQLPTDPDHLKAVISPIYESILTKYPPYRSVPEFRKEFQKRLSATNIATTDNPNVLIAQLVPGICHQDSGQVMSDGETILKCNQGYDTPPRMLVNKTKAEKRSDAAQLFVFGHEFSHNMNWASRELTACLSDNKSIDAKPVRKMSPSIVKTLMRWGGGWGEGQGSQLIGKFENLDQLDPETAQIALDVWQNSLPLDGLDEIGKIQLRRLQRRLTYAGNSDEEAKDEAKDAIAVKRGKIIAAGLPLLPKDVAIPVGGLPKDRRAVAAALRNLVPDMEQGYLPSQTEEMTADYLGGLLATEYIKQKYKSPEGRRQAALDVMRALPPLLYIPGAEKLMSKIASKPSYERRVLKVLLANPEFREMVGCEFEGATPRFCGGAPNAEPKSLMNSEAVTPTNK